ncbi:MAG: gamma-glutamyltransferase family protein [Acidimicrobiia bacterium]|nr:gamma-glutamyltransferase family protein [Acidimicrobiia bacterium]MDH5236017.1 gamma-glutamyltransferase family protein [Acidimicrobiia bacterium]
MTRVAIAAGSQIAADAGAAAAANGGNAVDAAIAASLASMCTDPGIIALGGGCFITISPPDDDAVVIDGYAEMPGRSAPPSRFGTGAHEVHLEYGGGMNTIVGHGSVATPGAVAGLGAASDGYGAIDWAQLIEPALHWAEQGFPLSGAAAEYLTYVHRLIFGWQPESHRVLHHRDGSPLREGETVRCPGLDRSLETLASHGPAAFYTGPLGRRIADDSSANGGLLTMADLAAYEAVTRRPLTLDLGDWTLHTNPGPSVGGAAVAAVLALIEDVDGWDRDNVVRIADAVHAVVTYRRNHLDHADDRHAAVDRLMRLTGHADPALLLSSPSTVHVSAVDADGLACSISTSSGYGSGVLVPGTGIWLNNSLGETELLSSGLHTLEPGTRLPSNMAPSVARREDGAVVAIGSPGASRITSAVAEVVFNHLRLGLPLADAVAHPRLHIEQFEGRPTIAYEPGIDVEHVTAFVPRPFDSLSMYFGGTQVASWDPALGLDATADPRRIGGVAFGG